MKRLAWIAATVGVVGLGTWYVLSSAGTCRETVRGEFSTPDGRWVLRDLLSQCGRARGSTIRLAMRPSGAAWNKGSHGLTDSGLVLLFAKELPLSHHFESDTLVVSCSGCTSSPLFWKRRTGLPFVLQVVDSSGTVLEHP